MDPRHKIALAMAATGCVSGQLREWPMLYDAFRYALPHEHFDVYMGKPGMTSIAKRILSKETK